MLSYKIICASVWRRWDTPIRSLSASWMSSLQGCRLLFPKPSQSDDVQVGMNENCVWRRQPVLLAVFYCCFVVNRAVCKKTSSFRERTCNNQRKRKTMEIELAKDRSQAVPSLLPAVLKAVQVGHWATQNHDFHHQTGIFCDPTQVQLLSICFSWTELFCWVCEANRLVGLTFYCWEASPEQ